MDATILARTASARIASVNSQSGTAPLRDTKATPPTEPIIPPTSAGMTVEPVTTVVRRVRDAPSTLRRPRSVAREITPPNTVAAMSSPPSARIATNRDAE